MDAKKFDITAYMDKTPPLDIDKGVEKNKLHYIIPAEQVIIASNGDEHTAITWFNNLTDSNVDASVHCASLNHTDEHPSAFLYLNQKRDALFCKCHSCKMIGVYYPEKKKLHSAMIDKESILATMEKREKTTAELASDIIEYLPALDIESPKDLTSMLVVDNILTNSLYTISKVNGELHLYDAGYWHSFSNEDEKRFFIRQSIEKSSKNKVRGGKLMIDHVIDELLEEYLQIDEVNTLVRINMKSNVLEIDKGKTNLVEHDQKYGFTYKMDYDYDTNVDTKYVFDHYLSVIEEEEAVLAFFEFFGSMFIPRKVLNMEVMLAALGTGSNSKSLSLNLIKQTIGSNNVSSLELQDFNNDTKLLLSRGKLLNIGTDIGSKNVNTGLMKRLTSSEDVVVDVKYKSAITVRKFPVMAFACNKLPDYTGDDSEGYYRRFMIMSFNRYFNEGERDLHLLEKLLEHKAAVLQLIIEGAMRLLMNKSFTKSTKIEESKKQYKRTQDTVEAFLQDCDVKAPQSEQAAFTKGKELLDSYVAYCIDQGRRPKGKNSFLARLRDLGVQTHKSGDDRGYKVIINKRLAADNQNRTTMLFSSEGAF